VPRTPRQVQRKIDWGQVDVTTRVLAPHTAHQPDDVVSRTKPDAEGGAGVDNGCPSGCSRRELANRCAAAGR